MEHSEHHASDPFDRRVAVTMAIIAAVLAGISMIGHRTHNRVLQLQGDGNRYATEAAAAEVEKSNLFAWYQSKKQRQSLLDISARQLELSPTTDEAARAKAIADYRDKAKDYDKPDPKRHESLPELIERGTAAERLVGELRKKAQHYSAEAEHVHHQADRLDLAHLLAEFGLVLCSVTILTKRKGWWFAGIVSAVLSLTAVGSAYLIPHETHASSAPGEPHAVKPEPGH